MMSKTAKKNYVEEMKKNFSSNESVMIAQYQGLNVNELDENSDTIVQPDIINVKLKHFLSFLQT